MLKIPAQKTNLFIIFPSSAVSESIKHDYIHSYCVKFRFIEMQNISEAFHSNGTRM